MNYGDICTGISAPTVAWKILGWHPQWYSEIEPFPCRVLKYHYPTVPNLGDMLKLEQNEQFIESTIDLLVGGTPCQSFSIAGLRGGLGDVRGNLSLEYCRILIAKRPRWFVWENVPGVFSSFTDDPDTKRYTGSVDNCFLNGEEPEYDISQTSDFATLLGAFSECGYSCAWRVLDAQYFGVPQRRRRVFVIGYLGNDWRPPFAVLFERESLQGNITPCRKRGPGVADPITKRPYQDRGSDRNIIMAHGQANAELGISIWPTLNCNHEAPILAAAASLNLRAEGSEVISEEISGTIQSNGNDLNSINPVLWSIMPQNSCKDYKARQVDVSQPLTTNGQFAGNQGGDLVQLKTIIRRLTPLECERLQGFPDNYTAIPRATDTNRYKAIGNSQPIPVMRWLGQRIDLVDKILKAKP